MCETDYTELLPTKPPEGLVQWCFQNQLLEGNYMVYRADSYYEPLEDRNIKAVRCKCTACGETAYFQYEKTSCSKAVSRAPFGFIHPETNELVLSGDSILCPMCGEKVTVYHCGKIGARKGSQIARAFPLTIHNFDGNLALLCWYISRLIDKWGEERIEVKPYDGYLFTKDKKIRFTGRERVCYNTRFLGKWKQLKNFQDRVGEFLQSEIFPWDKSVLNGTAAENCKLDIYIESAKRIYPISYINMWYRYPNIENLIVQGFGGYINDKLESTVQYGGISPQIGSAVKGLNLKKAKPTEILGISKEEIRYIKSKKWSNSKLDFYIRTKNQGITFENIDKIQKKYGLYDIEPLMGFKTGIPKSLRYLEKQRRKSKESRYTLSSRYLADYWDMAKKNGDDMTDENILYPHNLIRAHDSAQRLMELKASEKRAKAFEKRYRELKAYCFSYEGLSIHPARDEIEMIDEGKKLHHCVGTYAARYARGETAIFFIRHTEEEDVPYFTLEFDFKNMSVVQNRGLRNCERTGEVRKFEAEWVKYVKEVVKSERRAA